MKETELRIRIAGDPVLRRKARQVKAVTEHHRKLLSQMARMMYESSGIGLAAPQVGVDERLIVVDIGKSLYKLVNPEIVERSGRQSIEEGCLSVPGVSVKVKRAKCIVVQALDDEGKPVRIACEDLLAVVFQHEIDHLLGKLILDYVPVWKRALLKKKLQKLKEF
jgi:peptide deformylase